MLSIIHKDQYKKILSEINSNSESIFTQEEIANYLGVSDRTFRDFLKAKRENMELLMKYAAFKGYVFEFSIRKKNSIIDGVF